MKITILAVGSEAQYQPTFDTAYQYLKKETAALSAELSYAICRPDAAELFAALRNAMGQSEAVVLLLSPEPAAVSTALRVVCGGLERTAQTDAALQKQLEARAARMGLTLGYEQLADFASCPSGATQLPNAQGLVQGYAIAARRAAANGRCPPCRVSSPPFILPQCVPCWASWQGSRSATPPCGCWS